MSTPLVTVTMSAYNHEKYVERAILSVLNQTYKDFVFIVADDCSDDHTKDIILKYENQIDEIHLFDVNSGFGRGTELASYAQTKYIAVINSDDYWEPDKLEKQVEYMEQHPECGACFTLVNSVADDGGKTKDGLFETENRNRYEWMHYFFMAGNCLCHPSKLIRREVESWLRDGNNLGVFRQLPDYYMWINLVQKYEIHVIQERLVNFNWHGGQNMSDANKETIIRTISEGTSIWYQIMKQMEPDFFRKTFSKELDGIDAEDEIDIWCQKYLIMSFSSQIAIQQASFLFYADIMKDRQIYERLRDKYQYNNKDFYEAQVTNGINSLVVKYVP